MPRFLRRLALFLLPILVMAIAAEAYVRSIPNSYCIKQQALEQLADSLHTVILGNSHAYSGLRPDLLLGTVLNLANVSQTLDMDHALLLRCFRQCPQLRDVILVLDNSNLSDRPMEQTDEWFRITYYTLYMRRLGCHNPYLSRYGLELLHFQSFQGKIKKWRQQRQPDCTPLGWDTDNSRAAREDMAAEAAHAKGFPWDISALSEPDRIARAQAIAEWDSLRTLTTLSRHTIQNDDATRHNIDLVLQMASLCQQHGIRLTLLCTPVRPDYARGIPLRQQRLIEQTHRTCCQQYGARSIDLSRDTTFTHDEYFDPDHLTHEGAAHLTRLLQMSMHQAAHQSPD